MTRAALVLALAVLATPLRAAAAEPEASGGRSAPPGEVTGVVEEGREPGDPERDAVSAVTWLPRRAVEWLFFLTGSAAGLVEDEQVIPRVGDLLKPPPGEIRVFPTVFAETGFEPSVGARMLARTRLVGTTVRAGIGGPEDMVVESRLRVIGLAPLPVVGTLEALHDARSSLSYAGVGQRPERDSRNRFRTDTDQRVGEYRELRERFIAGVGLRPSDAVELFWASSFTRRHPRSPSGGEPDALERVFVPGSVPGADRVTRVVYSELALRIDTRAQRGGPATGVLAESYAGVAPAVFDEVPRFYRAGARAAAFIGIYKRGNVLSPKLTLDGVDVPGEPNAATLPFTELRRQPDFRGLDNRRDSTSATASLDYRWVLAKYVAARLLVDVATVGPSVAELDLAHPRPAYGFGLDLYGRSSPLGQVLIVASPEGGRFVLRFGLPSVFGDRMHRN